MGSRRFSIEQTAPGEQPTPRLDSPHKLEAAAHLLDQFQFCFAHVILVIKACDHEQNIAAGAFIEITLRRNRDSTG